MPVWSDKHASKSFCSPHAHAVERNRAVDVELQPFKGGAQRVVIFVPQKRDQSSRKKRVTATFKINRIVVSYFSR